MTSFQPIREGDKVLQILLIESIHLHRECCVSSLYQVLNYVPRIPVMKTECPWGSFPVYTMLDLT